MLQHNRIFWDSLIDCLVRCALVRFVYNCKVFDGILFVVMRGIVLAFFLQNIYPVLVAAAIGWHRVLIRAGATIQASVCSILLLRIDSSVSVSFDV